MIQTNNIFQLLGFGVTVILTLFTLLQGWKWYLNNEKEIATTKSNEAIVKANSEKEIALIKSNEAIAKSKENLLTAAQVVELMKQTQEVKSDLIDLRQANKEQNEDLIKAIDKIEDNMKSYEELFTKFLIARVNQLDQSLLKP